MGKQQRGFTLIELLVVIAIIGILSSVVLASLNGARKKGRDARRISDVKQVQLALEMYYDSNSSTYPVQATYGALPSGLAPTYIATVPADPTNSSPFIYQYQTLDTGGTTACSASKCHSYILTTYLENGYNTSSVTGTHGTANCVQSGGSPALGYIFCVMP